MASITNKAVNPAEAAIRLRAIVVAEEASVQAVCAVDEAVSEAV